MAILTNGLTREGWDPVDAMKRLEDGGADVVGLNCARGPRTMLPLLKRIRRAVGCEVAPGGFPKFALDGASAGPEPRVGRQASRVAA